MSGLEFDRLISVVAGLEHQQGWHQVERRKTLEQVVELYRGDLLQGCYEEWVLSEREKRSRVFIQAMGQLIALLEEERQYATAIEYTQRLLRYDLLQEATYRTLMRLLAVTGDVAGMVRTYQLCVTTLKRELEVEPSLITRLRQFSVFIEQTYPHFPGIFETKIKVA